MSYIAYQISDSERSKIWSKFPPKYKNKKTDHITYQFGPKKGTELPDQPKVVIAYGYAHEEGIEALVCSVDGKLFRPDGKRFHITLSHNEKRKPVHSNDVIQKGFDEIIPFKIAIEDVLLKENMKVIVESLQDVKKLKFYKALDAKGDIYMVGGSVRDEMLGKNPKDIDLLVTKLSYDEIADIIEPFGKVNKVGKSFGVIKFKADETGEEYDIALPRREVKTSEGHKGFDVESDKDLPIEKDLERRDFTINSFAIDKKGDIVDPFGGQEDLKKKLIRVVNPRAFSEDPLRMLRAVQFASRLGFKIEPNTLEMIKKNAHSIKEISGERIIIEFDKIVNKGDMSVAVDLLDRTGLYKEIFNSTVGPSKAPRKLLKKAKTMGEFIFLLTAAENFVQDDVSDLWHSKFKGDKETEKELHALNLAFMPQNSIGEYRYLAHRIYKISPDVFSSSILSEKMKSAINDLKTKYPKTLKDLKIDGTDLSLLQIKGAEIGKKLDYALRGVYNDDVKNNHSDLLEYIK